MDKNKTEAFIRRLTALLFFDEHFFHEGKTISANPECVHIFLS